MSKGLEALEELKFQVGNITYHTRDLQITTFKVRDSGLFEVIEKELKSKEKTDKVLEIVKTLFHSRCKLYERTENIETCNEAGCHAEKVATTSYILEFRNYDLHYEFHLDREEYDLLWEILVCH